MNTAAATVARTDIPAIGTPMQGGFLAGLILIAGQAHGLIVAPKAPGETSGKWGEFGQDIEGARHLNDGLLNTQALADAGSPIATWARGLEINGHTDWYVPSRDELEVIYRNLKPTTGENFCGFRDGENAFSVPMGMPYTKGMPGQSGATPFQQGQEEALDATWYWSSTQSSAPTAFIQFFSGGDQYYFRKDLEYRVRAVRRFLID